jgi:hypothetical protein
VQTSGMPSSGDGCTLSSGDGSLFILDDGCISSSGNGSICTSLDDLNVSLEKNSEKKRI